MIERLWLERFKNFRDAELALGGLTLLVGTNASGKSNLGDAFRFLRGIALGWPLAEIIGGKFEAGVLVWAGIRGGSRELAFLGEPTFALQTTWLVPSLTPANGCAVTYRIEVATGTDGGPPRVIRESLHTFSGSSVFDAQTDNDLTDQLSVRLKLGDGKSDPCKMFTLPASQPVLSQLATRSDLAPWPALLMQAFSSMRFFDLASDAMRRPSLPGQGLGERGENLSSVLKAICADTQLKTAVLEWLRELTPQDVVDFEFVPDPTGKILVSLVEGDGKRISAYSASDGTLRLLGMIAALLRPGPAKFYFVEELDSGLHPTRLHLLLELIEQTVSRGGVRVVATTHSPQLLGLLSEKARENAALVYRLTGRPDAQIRRIMDIPEAERVLRQQDLARLHASGWLEDAVAFLEAQEVEA